eukprot:g13213.t1
MLTTQQTKPNFSAARDKSFPTAAGEPPKETTAHQAPPVKGRRLRGSCDFCTKRKRKCDGDGVNRCSFCIAKNQPNCHYSVRLLTGPRADSASRRASSKGLVGKAAARATPPSTTAAAGGSWGGGGGGGGGIATEPRYPAVLPLKRARLSPSPATGLIGLKENVYIGEFFRTLGFLPITSESFIRKAMVRTMFSAVQERGPGFAGFSAGGGVWCEEEEVGWGEGAVVPGAGPGDAIENAASSCVLWCTVAVGCLIGGRPKSSVNGYAQLAREALSGCFDDGSSQTARAFTAMALLQNFMGNKEKFNKHIDFAKSIMKALPPGEVPIDLTDTHMFVKACDMFHGLNRHLDQEDLREAMGAISGKNGDHSLSKEPKLLQQAELCRWLLKTDIRLAACFSLDMQNMGFFAQPPGVADSGSRFASEPDGDGNVSLSSNGPPHVVYDEVPETGPDSPAERIVMLRQTNEMMDTLLEPPPPGPMSLKFAAQVMPDVNLMLTATQSPAIRGGVGELYFRSIIAYVCCLQGQQGTALDGLSRCTDILVTNPGICRFSAWKHLAHCCLACMYVAGQCDRYEELRRAYNSVIDDDGGCTKKIPPPGEFRGMDSICSGVLCKSIFNFFMKTLALKQESSEDEPKQPYSPKVESQDVGSTSFSPGATDESWARGVFDKHRQSAQTAATGPPRAPEPEPAELGEASGFEGAFSSSTGKERQPRATAVGSGFAVRARSAGSMTASISSSISTSVSDSASDGPIEAGNVTAGVATFTAAAPAPAPSSTAAGRDVDLSLDRSLDKRQGDGPVSLPLLATVPSAPSAPSSSSNAAPDHRDSDKSMINGDADGGLALLDAYELEGAEGAGLLDAVDALLGEAALEGFGEEGGSEEDLLPLFKENA